MIDTHDQVTSAPGAPAAAAVPPPRPAASPRAPNLPRLPHKTLRVQRALSATPTSSPSTRSSGRNAPPKSPTTAGKVIFQTGERRGAQDLDPSWPPRSSSPNTFTASKARPSARPPSGSSSTASAAPSRTGASRDGYFTKADGEIYYDELTWLCLNQHGAFRSPRHGSASVSITNAASGKKFRQGRLVLQPPDRPGANAPEPSTNIPRAARASVRSGEDNMEDIMLPGTTARRCSSSTAPAPART